MVPVVVSVAVETYVVVVPEMVWVEVTAVETVDVATVLVDVVYWVVVEVAVTGTVVTVVTGPGPNRKINPFSPTAQPSVEATIQTSSKSRGTAGTGYTRVQVEPSQ
jgi:hypothetical protein